MPYHNPDKKCALYRITHVASGRDYIGISVDVHKRWTKHKFEAARGSRALPKFYAALSKYGPDAFDWKIIAWARNFTCACELEKMARHLGLGALNCTMGGDGIIGLEHSPESRQKISQSNKGKKRSPEVVAAMRLVPHKPHTAEAKAKISAAGIGRVFSQEARDKSAAKQRGVPKKKHTPESKAKISAAHKGKPKSAEHSANISKGKKGKPGITPTPETLIKLSAASKAYNESLREAGIVIKRSEEARARMSASALARYDRVRAENGGKVPPPHDYSPECRAKMRATKAANKAAKNK